MSSDNLGSKLVRFEILVDCWDTEKSITETEMFVIFRICCLVLM